MKRRLSFYIVTFGCQQNQADSERITAAYLARGFKRASSRKTADAVIINTCMIRESAENRVYGLVYNLSQEKKSGRNLKIVLTGCMVGMAVRDKSGKLLTRLRTMMPLVDEFLPIEEVGFDLSPVRTDVTRAFIPVTNGCNNFCTYCVVPFTRGREVSRPFRDVENEVREAVSRGITWITLLGQNVNSYGSDLVNGNPAQTVRDVGSATYFRSSREPASVNIAGREFKPVYVKHLGRMRIPTLFPQLLDSVAGIPGVKKLDFMSSNPWDVSDELIEVISQHPNISRQIHLPVQSGDDGILRKMNRWYTRGEYLALITRMKDRIPGISFTTDIIVGFSGETENEYANTKRLAMAVGFSQAFISMYSPRRGTASYESMPDDVPHAVKRKRWQELDTLINGYIHE